MSISRGCFGRFAVGYFSSCNHGSGKNGPKWKETELLDWDISIPFKNHRVWYLQKFPWKSALTWWLMWWKTWYFLVDSRNPLIFGAWAAFQLNGFFWWFGARWFGIRIGVPLSNSLPFIWSDRNPTHRAHTSHTSNFSQWKTCPWISDYTRYVGHIKITLLYWSLFNQPVKRKVYNIFFVWLNLLLLDANLSKGMLRV